MSVSRPLIGALVALAAALSLALPASAGAADRKVPLRFHGGNWDGDIQRETDPELINREWARMATSGVEAARTSFEWFYAQPEPGGPFDFSRTDLVVTAAATHGVDVLPVVIWAPRWARRDAETTFSPPRNPTEYGAYLTALIGRYGPDGTFWTEHPDLPRRPIRNWQIWNEPHLPYQWTVPQSEDWARGYGRLLSESYRAVKTADSKAKIVLAGLSNFSWRYLRRLYERAEIRGFFDVVAVHPYTRTPQGVVEIVRRVRRVTRKRGDGGKPTWITELGLPAAQGRTGSDNVLQTTDQGMAKFLRGSYVALARARRSRATRVRRAYWYTWASEYEGPEIFRYTGLLQYDQESDSVFEKPAFAAFQRIARKHQGCSKAPNGTCLP